MNAFPALALLALTGLHGCASAPLGATQRELAVASAQVTAAVAAQAPPPLYLEVWPTVHGTARGPLFSDMGLHSGDQIGLQVRTSSVAHVYLIHCDAREALSVFPALGPMRFPADQRVDLPAVGKSLRLTDVPGDEALYIVASKRPLDQSDPALQAALAGAQQGGGASGCGRRLEALLAGASAEARQAQAARARSRCALRGVEGADYPSVARAFAEADGVVVLRFRYRHLP